MKIEKKKKEISDAVPWPQMNLQKVTNSRHYRYYCVGQISEQTIQ